MVHTMLHILINYFGSYSQSTIFFINIIFDTNLNVNNPHKTKRDKIKKKKLISLVCDSP